MNFKIKLCVLTLLTINYTSAQQSAYPSLQIEGDSIYTKDSVEIFYANGKTYSFKKLDADAGNFPKVLISVYPNILYRKIHSGSLNFGGDINITLGRINLYGQYNNSLGLDDHEMWASESISANETRHYTSLSVIGSYFINEKKYVKTDVSFPITAKKIGMRMMNGIQNYEVTYAYTKALIYKRKGVSVGYTRYGGTVMNFRPDGNDFDMVDVNGVKLPDQYPLDKYNTSYDISVLKIGVITEQKQKLVLKKVNENEYHSKTYLLQNYVHLIIPFRFKVDPIVISDDIYKYNGDLLINAGSYDVLHTDKNLQGGFLKSNKIGFCYGLKYYKSFRSSAFGYNAHLEAGMRPSLIINETYYRNGFRSKPIYLEMGFGITF